MRRRIVRELKARPLVLVAVSFLTLLVLVAVFAPIVANHDPEQGSLRDTLQGPSGVHWLDTDQLGRDVFSRLVFGARVALLAASEAVIVAVVLGVPIGLVLGFRGGWVDRIAMRLIDGLSAIPGIVLAISIIAALGTGLVRAMLAVGIVGATVLARLTRGQVLAVRERLYIDAARVSGASQWSLLFRHALPNVAPTLVVQATLLFATAIIVEAGLSFIGLGVQPPDPSWGVMLSSAQEVLDRQAFNAIPPGAAIFATVLAAKSSKSGVGDSSHWCQNHRHLNGVLSVAKGQVSLAACQTGSSKHLRAECALEPLCRAL